MPPVSDALSRMRDRNPSFKKASKQKRIVNLLDTSKKEIDVLKQLDEQYRIQKRGLMQKLLTGKWRIRNQSTG